MKHISWIAGLRDRWPGCRRALAGRAVAATLVAAWIGSLSAWATDFELVSNFGSNPGNLKMYKYVPKESDQPRPMVVVLHGCKQDHLYARDAGWDKLAEKYNFVLLVPEQLPATVNTMAFIWWEFKSGPMLVGTEPQTKPEVQSIKQMMDKMKADYKIDAQRVFITGLSAGGGMTAVMIASHPDQFAGAGICSGLPHRSATTLPEAYIAMFVGKSQGPQDWAKLVRNENPNYNGPYPIVSIWHGQSDTTVVPKNATEQMKQWTAVHGIGQTGEDAEMPGSGCSGTHKVYKDSAGKVLVETYLIQGMPHATAIDPGPGKEQGGVESQYVKNEHIFSSYYIAKFWGILDSIPPDPVSLKIKVNAVYRLIGGDDPVAVAKDIQADPPVTSDQVLGWRTKFVDAGTAALQ